MKQTVTILLFLVLLAALLVGMAYGMAWLVNLGKNHRHNFYLPREE